MVIIRSNEIKLEETTVTLQSIHPKNPTTNKATKALQPKGSMTQWTFLKTAPSVKTNIIKTPWTDRKALVKLEDGGTAYDASTRAYDASGNMKNI